MANAQILRLRALKDNYCFLVHATGSQKAIVIDPGEARPVIDELTRANLELGLILNTHHHHDHVGGNAELKKRFDVPVFCSAFDRDRVPGADRGLQDNELVSFEGLDFRVLAIPGHTQGQIAFHFERDQALFAGDTIFEMGCGRLFEGTPEQMWMSFARLRKLPPTTRLFFGHEYTERNGEFALTVEPDNAPAIQKVLRAAEVELARTNFVNVPTLAEELAVNPFLRARDVAAFAEMRKRRDTW